MGHPAPRFECICDADWSAQRGPMPMPLENSCLTRRALDLELLAVELIHVQKRADDGKDYRPAHRGDSQRACQAIARVRKSVPVRTTMPRLYAILKEYRFPIGSDAVTPTRALLKGIDGAPPATTDLPP